ncbi:MAG: tRNA 4-thiouridine(8) synthase ThiI [bacterium]
MSEDNLVPERKARGLVLLSGGLDSTLAICVLREQGLDVTALCFVSPFFDDRKARKAADSTGVALLSENFSEAILGLLSAPKHGFGSGMNPCIDCHAAMLRRAGEIMQRDGYDFIATGEVLDQRPMSQRRKSLDVVANESGWADRIVRPLSALLLPVTAPEREGLVDRTRLLSLSGRNRKPQFALAAHYGIVDYPTPAGGCRLTEPNYVARLRDLVAHEGLGDRRGIERLRLGRHFRLASGARIMVGRSADDNAAIEADAQPGERVITLDGGPGPTGLVTAGASPADLAVAAGFVVRYGDLRSEAPGSVCVKTVGGGQEHMTVMPIAEAQVELCRIK